MKDWPSWTTYFPDRAIAFKITAIMRKVLGIILISGLSSFAYGQMELFRTGDVVQAYFDGEILATNVYVTSHIPDLTGVGVPAQNEMFQAGYAKVRSQLVINEAFIIGLGLTWWGVYSGYPKKNYPFLSEAYIISDTLHWPFAQKAFIYGGRMRMNYGTGLLISDFYGTGYNTFGLTMQFTEQQPIYLDFLYLKLSEGGGNQIDITYFPVAYNTDSTKAYKWISTKYDLETYGIVLRKTRREDQPFAMNLYLTTLLEDRNLEAFLPFWTGFYLDVGPIKKFSLKAELGYLFGQWLAKKPIYNDFPDQLYEVVRGCDPAIDGDNCPGFRFNSLAYTINVRYDASETFSFGVGYSSFQGDDGTTPDVYEGWFSPTLRSELNVNSDWSKWSGLGEIFTFGMKPGLYRDVFGSDLSDLRILNVYFETSPYTIFHSLKTRFDFFAYWEYWGPQYEFYTANPTDYPLQPNTPYSLDIGYEFDLTFRMVYADFADVGIILGYFIPGTRLKYGWARPGTLRTLDLYGTLEDVQYVHTLSSGSIIARFWIYRQINF